MAALAKRRVLVVEDSYYLASDAARALSREGASVLGPYSREDAALAALANDAPDCVVLDINLGEGVRFGLADRLVERGVPFLFFTGYDRATIPARFADVPCLQKPVKADHLVKSVEGLCRPA